LNHIPNTRGIPSVLSRRPRGALRLALAVAVVLAWSPSGVHAAGSDNVDGYSGATALAAGAAPSYLRSLRPIEVFDDHTHAAIAFTLDDVCKYHGHLGPVPVCAYRALQAAIALLWVEKPPRDDIRVVTTGPSQCARDVFELITRADSRGDFEVRVAEDVEGLRVPGPPLSLSCFSFEIASKSTAGRVHLQVRPGVIPDEFFDLARLAHSSEENHAESDAMPRFMEIKRKLMKRMATMPIADLFAWEVTPGAPSANAAS